MKVLLTIDLSAGKWANGLFQNTFFFAKMLLSMGYNVAFLVHHPLKKCKFSCEDIPVFRIKDVLNFTNIDALIQISWIASDNVVRKILSKNKNCKNIHVHYGNKMIADIEEIKHKNKLSCTPFMVDEVWISPHFEFSMQYYETYYGCTVKVCPYIWSSEFIDKEEKLANKLNRTMHHDPEKEISLCCLDSNMTFLKRCVPSVIAFEYLIKKYDVKLNLDLYCSAHLIDKKYFNSWIKPLKTSIDNRITYYDRHPPSKIFGPNNYGCISHQVFCDLNYSYLECLYFGVPIVHNSKYFKDFGFYYTNYNTNDAGEKIFEMISTYNSNYKKHLEKNNKIFDEYSPKNPSIIKKYKEMIE